MSHAYSGRSADAITMDALADGELSLDDIRIHPDTLEHQAQVAESLGNRQLAENFRRAGELTAFPDDEVLSVYEALRPGRSTPAQLRQIADSFDGRSAPRCAAFIREAADTYERCGLGA